MTYVKPGQLIEIPAHPVITGFDGVEPKFLLDELIQPFVVINTEYAVEYDENLQIARFTNMSSHMYMVMARDVHAINRPDITLPWGHFRLRSVKSPGAYEFVHCILDEDQMDQVLRQPPHHNGVNGVGFYKTGTIVGHYRVNVARTRFLEVREKQITEVTALTYRREEENETSELFPK